MVDRNARDFRRRYNAKRDELDEFSDLLDAENVPEPTRSTLYAWVESHLLAPVLEFAESRLRGIQHKN